MNKHSKDIVAELKERGFKVRFHYRRYSAQRLPSAQVKVKRWNDEWESLDTPAYIVGKLITLKEAREKNLELWQNGGLTKVAITAPNGDVYEAEAKCVKKDKFDREKGRTMSVGRALKKIPAGLLA